MAITVVDVVNLSGALGALAVIGAACKYGFNALRKTYQAIEIISKIYDELKPNGGSSIKDAITRIERTQEDFRTQLSVLRRKLYAILQETQTCIFESDASGQYIWVNKHLCQLLGKTPEELYGFSWLVNVPAKEREQIEKEWLQAISQKREYVASHKLIAGSHTINVTCHAWPLINQSSLTGYMGTYTITNDH